MSTNELKKLKKWILTFKSVRVWLRPFESASLFIWIDNTKNAEYFENIFGSLKTLKTWPDENSLPQFWPRFWHRTETNETLFSQQNMIFMTPASCVFAWNVDVSTSKTKNVSNFRLYRLHGTYKTFVSASGCSYELYTQLAFSPPNIV